MIAAIPIWSAVPTPLTTAGEVDVRSVQRMVAAAIQDGVEGLFVAGTCGEGPWLPDRERRRLMEATVQAAAGKLTVAAQVSDNSVARILDNAAMAAAAGVDVAIIAPPATFLNATPDRIVAHFTEAAQRCPLPVGIYDLGKHRPIMIPQDRLLEIYQLPQVRLVKDSSGSPERRAVALEARRSNPALRLLNGDEFRCLEYLEAGYDSVMFGGAVAVAPQVRRIGELFLAGRMDEARAADDELRRTLFGIYGGESISCWLTGLKYYMVRRGWFDTANSFLGYPLTDECRAFVERQAAADAEAQLSRVA
jgi:4-hydroxy-tetrahydrodipicolinate synthase